MKLLGAMLVFFLLTLAASAQDADTPPQVTVETSSAALVYGESWTLTLLVDHSDSGEVTVIAPQFAPFLSLDRLVKIPRTAGGKTRTAVEYRFIPNRQSGDGGDSRFTLEPFTVITPAGVTATSPLVLQVRGSGAAARPMLPRIAWENAPGQMTAGESASFSLRVYGWKSQQPPPEFFMPEVPRGAILSLSPLSPQEREGGIAIKLSLIPLDGDFYLSARILQYENYVFEIPALRVNVRGRRMSVSTSVNGGVNAGGEQPSPETSSPLEDTRFPDFDYSVFDRSIMGKLWRRQSEDIYNTARDLWEKGQRAQALAELRHNEKHHPAGALLRQVRRDAEESLMFFNTKDESRWRRRFLLGLSSFLFLLVIILPFACFMFFRHNNRINTAGRKKTLLLTAALCAVFFAALGFLCLYGFVDSRGVFNEKNSNLGITVETPVRRTVDIEGEELFTFREGQPVVIMLNSGGWVFVRTNNNAGGFSDSSGWIPANTVLFY